jgi:hypothetical protein
VTQVELTKSGNRIFVTFPYSPLDVQKVKAVGGGRWNASQKVWTFGLSLKTCQGLREQFGDRLLISPVLAEWAWEERRRLEALEAIRDGAMDVEPQFTRLPEISPLLYDRLRTRPYQMQGVAFAIAGGSVLIGDQPGLGKTYEALGIIAESGARRVLISCPRTAVRAVWEGHINELLPLATVHVAQGVRATREAVFRDYDETVTRLRNINSQYPSIMLVNHEMVRVRRMYRCMINPNGQSTKFVLDDQPEFKNPPGSSKNSCQSEDHEHRTMYYPEYPELFREKWDMVIMDESHKTLASTSNKQSKNITQARLGAVRLPVSDIGRRIAVSATPNRSKANKAWGTLNWLRPDVFASYWRWAEEFFNVSDSGWGGAREVSDKPTDVEQFRDAMRPYMIARIKSDVAPELPPIEYAGTPHPDHPEITGVWLEMLPEQQKAYRQMLELGSADVDGGTLNAIGLLAEITRRKQFASSLLMGDFDDKWLPCLPSNKVDWILQFLEEREGFDGKVVIASQFTQLLYMIREVLIDSKYQSMILTGDTSDKERLRFVQKFQDPDDPCKIGLINSKAGGESITLDQADDMILIDEPWTDDEKRQLEDRIHRVSRIHNVTVYVLRSLGTIEEKIALLTDEQRLLISQLRPEGKKLARELLDER